MVKSNNEAAGEEALHVCGSPHPGDEVLQKWAALMGVGLTQREGTKGTDLVYEPHEIGDVLHRHFVHDRITPDILRDRKEDPDDDGATLYYIAGDTSRGPLPDEYQSRVLEGYSKDTAEGEEIISPLIFSTLASDAARACMKSVVRCSSSSSGIARSPEQGRRT